MIEYRQALRYVIRNTTLPARTRAVAQLQLTQMHAYTRPTQTRNRCILGGKSRGVLREFKMTRVRPISYIPEKGGVEGLRVELRLRRGKHAKTARLANIVGSQTVQLPYERTGGSHSGCQEGLLVKESMATRNPVVYCGGCDDRYAQRRINSFFETQMGSGLSCWHEKRCTGLRATTV